MKRLWITLGILASVIGAERLPAGESVSRKNGWQAYVRESTAETGAAVDFRADSAVVTSSSTALDPTCIQVFKIIDVEPDKNYKVTFQAESDKAGVLTVYYCLAKSPWFLYAKAEVEIVQGHELYECTLTVQVGPGAEYEGPRSLRFLFGAFEDANITISDVSFDQES